MRAPPPCRPVWCGAQEPFLDLPLLGVGVFPWAAAESRNEPRARGSRVQPDPLLGLPRRLRSGRASRALLVHRACGPHLTAAG